MSISRQTLTIVIVTFKSEKVIDNCIKSISDQIKIIVVDNSNDQVMEAETDETDLVDDTNTEDNSNFDEVDDNSSLNT